MPKIKFGLGLTSMFGFGLNLNFRPVFNYVVAKDRNLYVFKMEYSFSGP